MSGKTMLTEEQIAGIVQGMSDNAKNFVQKLAADESFRDKFATAKSAEEMVQMSKDEGVTINLEELKSIMLGASNMVMDASGELPDEDLERVAGGGSDDAQWASAASAA